MISYGILSKGFVIIEPSGPLAEDNFIKLTRDVDSQIEKRENLKGIIIHAKSFPGWENFGAFIHHFKFIKGHHNKIIRVAAVVDSKLLTFMPKLVNNFVSEEVKHFDYANIEEAKEWIKGEKDN